MSRYPLNYRNALGLVVLVAIFGFTSETANGQAKFRGPNTIPPIVVFPPAPNIPMNNNGSLYTFPNPTAGLPNQLPFAYIAVANQDCRLYHNGATLMPMPRLVAGQCTDMQPAVIPASNGFIPTYQSVLFPINGGGGGAAGAAGAQGAGGAPPGGIQGFGANRSPIPVTYPGLYPSYSPGYDAQRYYGGAPYLGYMVPVPYTGFNMTNNLSGTTPQSGFFSGDPQAALGNFGGQANALGAFKLPEDADKAPKPDADDPKKDNGKPAKDDADKQAKVKVTQAGSKDK
jgi:hypothetical protein